MAFPFGLGSFVGEKAGGGDLSATFLACPALISKAAPLPALVTEAEQG